MAITSADTDVADSSFVYNYAKIVLVAVNFFVQTNRMEPFVAVYYIMFKDWNPTNIGVVSLVMNITMLVAQTPMADILDKTTNKKMITAVAEFIAGKYTHRFVISCDLSLSSLSLSLSSSSSSSLSSLPSLSLSLSSSPSTSSRSNSF